MISELDIVALTRDVPEHALLSGDVGTVVLVHGGGDAYEIEFVRADGFTVAVLTLDRSEVRALNRDILHARPIAG